MYGHDPQHIGYSTSNAPDTSSIIWIYDTDEWMISSPAIVDEKVYISSGDMNLYCLNATDGSFVWSYQIGIGEDIMYSSPTVVDNKLYIGSEDGNVYCLNAINGSFIWAFTTGDLVTSSPVVYEDKVYVGSENSNVYCLNVLNGELIWNFDTDGYVESSPAVYNGRVYVGSEDENIYCLDALDGTKIWNYTTGNCVWSSPGIYDEKLYIGSEDGNVYCLHSTNGDLIWSYPCGRVDSSPTFYNGNVYIGSWNKKIYCLNASNGDVIWDHETDGWLKSSPAVADGKVYVGSYDHNVYCLYASNGTEIWNYTTEDYIWSSPAIADGKLYIGSGDGKIYVFGSNQQPYQPINPDPVDDEIDVSVNTDLSWAGGDPDSGDTVTYDVYFGTANPPTTKVVNNQSATSFTPGILDYEQTYYWKIIAWDNHDISAESPTWSFTTEEEPGDQSWWNNDWQYRKEIIIDHEQVDADLNNFPVLIRHTFLDTSHVQSDGDDFVFTDDLGNKFNHEIELYDNITGQLFAWVNIPILSSTNDTVLYLYYGNPSCDNQENISGVWDSNFVMVQHHNESSGTRFDSTLNGFDATPNNVAHNPDGMIDGADTFDGSSSYLNLGTSSTLQPIEGTISVWINLDTTDGRRTIYTGSTVGSNSRHPELFIYNGVIHLILTDNSAEEWHFGNSISENVTYHIAVSWNGTKAILYMDGSVVNIEDQTIVPVGNSYTKRIGALSPPSWPDALKGTLDEFRMSNIPRDPSWIKTSYNNQRFSSNFITIGPEEEPNFPPDIPSDPYPNDDATGVSRYADLSWAGGDPDGDDINYSVYFGTDPTPDSSELVSENQSTTTYNPGTLSYSTTYYWRIVANDGIYAVEGPLWSFTTRSGPSCFLAGTRVTMADGSYKSIEDVNVGDKVKSYDIANKREIIGVVAKTLHHEPEEMPDYYVVINNELRVTPNHCLYMNDDEWVQARDIKLGDSLSTAKSTIQSVETVYEQVTTYDLEVQSLLTKLTSKNKAIASSSHDPEGTAVQTRQQSLPYYVEKYYLAYKIKISERLDYLERIVPS